MSFFDLPAAAIDAAALEAFLSERLPESINLEYKGSLADTVYETIAAMANTYGGIVLVGVEEDKSDPPRPVIPAKGVEDGDRAKLVNAAYTLLTPPFVVDVVPVMAYGDRQVLVVRIDPARVDRPIFVSRKDAHKVLFRLEARNAPADRSRMAALFAEPPGHTVATAVPSNPNRLHQVQAPVDDRNVPALVVRVVLEAAIPYEQLDRAKIDTNVRTQFDQALVASPLTAWLSELAAQTGARWHGEWGPLGLIYTSHSGQTVHRWRGTYAIAGEFGQLPLPTGGQAFLSVPSVAHAAAGRVVLVVDMTFDPRTSSKVIEANHQSIPNELRFRRVERLTLRQFYDLILALLETALDVVAPATFPELLGVPIWQRIGPTADIHTFQDTTATATPMGIGKYVELAQYVEERVEPNLDLPAASPFYVPRSASFETRDERAAVVKEWLTRLLLDMGLAGFESELASF